MSLESRYRVREGYQVAIDQPVVSPDLWSDLVMMNISLLIVYSRASCERGWSGAGSYPLMMSLIMLV